MEPGKVKGDGGDRYFLGTEYFFFLEGTCYLKACILPLQRSLNSEKYVDLVEH